MANTYKTLEDLHRLLDAIEEALEDPTEASEQRIEGMSWSEATDTRNTLVLKLWLSGEPFYTEDDLSCTTDNHAATRHVRRQILDAVERQVRNMIRALP